MTLASENPIVKPYYEEAIRAGWSRGRENATRVELTRLAHFIYLVPRVANVSIVIDPRLSRKLGSLIERPDLKHSGLSGFPRRIGLKLKALLPTDFGNLVRTLP